MVIFGKKLPLTEYGAGGARYALSLDLGGGCKDMFVLAFKSLLNCSFTIWPLSWIFHFNKSWLRNIFYKSSSVSYPIHIHLRPTKQIHKHFDSSFLWLGSMLNFNFLLSTFQHFPNYHSGRKYITFINRKNAIQITNTVDTALWDLLVLFILT